MFEKNAEIIIDIVNLNTVFGQSIVHENLNLQIYKGEVLGIVGGSGSGKTTLIREILMLTKPKSGSINVLNKDLASLSVVEQQKLSQNWAMMFQDGALFTSLTVLENVSFPLQEFTQLRPSLIREIALYKLSMVKFPLDLADLYLSELSGGMIKRAALARAIALDAQILFLDEPTAGLDPESAASLDELILHLKNLLKLTVIIITHDIDTLWRVTDRVAFIGEKRVLAIDSIDKLCMSSHPLLQAYFTGPRGRVAALQHKMV